MDKSRARLRRRLSAAIVSLGLLAAPCQIALAEHAPLARSAQAGVQSTWHGFTRYDFEVDGKPAMVIAPSQAAEGCPWLWHGEYFGTTPALDVALLGRGYHIAYLSIPNLFGSPAAVKHWNSFYKHLTQQRGLSTQPALMGLSRGGLYAYNWAAENPEKVACIYGDAPVCDLKSWPLGQGKGTGNSAEAERILKLFEVSSGEELLKVAHSPIDRLRPLAEAGVPILHVYGDADTGVPWEENSGVVAQRYRELGGKIELIAKPGIGHVHGLDDFTPVIEFIEQSNRSSITPAASNR